MYGPNIVYMFEGGMSDVNIPEAVAESVGFKPRNIDEGRKLVIDARRHSYTSIAGGYLVDIGGQQIPVRGSPEEMPSIDAIAQAFNLPITRKSSGERVLRPE